MIEIGTLSYGIADQVRDDILDGILPASARINEVHLARRLGVSRTPLREALTRLAGEGAVTALPRLGFFVVPLSLDELEEIYPIRRILDVNALRSAGLPPTAALDEIEAINAALLEATDPRDAVALDDRWHMTLLAHCRNRTLIALIEQFMWRTKRYELALYREEGSGLRTAGDHEAVIAALRSGDLEAGCAALESNMVSGLGPLRDWLRRREDSR